MATHSCILAWEIPWIEEPGRLQSMGRERIRHDLATKQQQQRFYQRTLNYYIYLCTWLSHLLDFELFEDRSLDSLTFDPCAREKQI